MRNVLLSRWVLGFVGAALLAALAWLFGPFVAALEAVLPRAVVVAALLLAWAGINLLLDWRARRHEAALTAGVTDPGAAASEEEAAALAERMKRALAVLKKARGTRGYLYEQPWYVIIGPPGAGKTTALLNAGLKFPLADEMGEAAVAGVGGTRLCDWWFTDSAVLIDTAGRYTTQDSDAAVDKAGWEGFLGLLRRTRPRQPLNGVIIAIALTDIAQNTREERLRHAVAVRRRLKELRDRLGVRLPVYALFTKADLVAGFTEFFDDLDRERRAQVWGTTFPLEQPATGSAAAFPPAFRALVERLEGRVLERLQAERSAERRALIAGFPAQVASLGAALQEFLEAAFGGARLDPAPLLRGAYFSSGTQEGTPIDRLTGALARSFAIDQRRAPSLRPEGGRSYFLARLLRQVILGEAMLVAEPPGVARRRRMLQVAGAAAVVLAVLAGGAALWRAQAGNSAAVMKQDEALAAYREAAARLPLDRVTDGDLRKVLPLLDQARALTQVPATPAIASQGEKLEAAGGTVYRHALERVLLPRLVWRLETQMRDALTRPDFLYEATRVYLMLGGAGPLDRDFVRSWMALDWQRQFPAATDAPTREGLARHLDALLAQPLPTVALDGGLVEQARAVFSRLPLASRIYARIVPSAAAATLPPWRPADALGQGGLPFFGRISGKPLTDGIPGLYSPAGLQRVLLPALPGTAREVAGESWVLGKQETVSPGGPELATLEHDVLALYAADYVRQWDALLADLTVVPARTLPQAAQQLYVLGSPQSPMRALLAAIVQQLAPSAAPAPTAAAAKAVPAALQKVLGQPAAAAPGQEIDEHYRGLRDYLGQPGQAAPFDRALQAIGVLQQDLSRLAAAPSGTAPAPGADPVLPLKAEAAEAPQPVQRWLLAIAGGGAALRAGGARQQAAAAFNGAGGPGPLCMQAVNGRYPFVAGAASAIPLDDFSRLFAPGGLLDAYFNTALRPFVDTSGRVWKANDTAGAAPVSAGELAEFQRAATIRDMFFPAGATPALRFEVTPVELDPGAKQVTLDLGGAAIAYAHGPLRGTQVAWPAQGGSTARLTFDPPAPGGPIQASGPWALFRLLGKGTLRSEGTPDSYTLTFQQGERRAVFAIRTGSVVNPLASDALRGFRCPVLH